jgi:endothelin-converting enzyme
MGQWQSQPVCTTPSCIHAASFVLKNLAPEWEKMDPCTDFDKSEQPSAHSR